MIDQFVGFCCTGGAIYPLAVLLAGYGVYAWGNPLESSLP